MVNVMAVWDFVMAAEQASLFFSIVAILVSTEPAKAFDSLFFPASLTIHARQLVEFFPMSQAAWLMVYLWATLDVSDQLCNGIWRETDVFLLRRRAGYQQLQPPSSSLFRGQLHPS